MFNSCYLLLTHYISLSFSLQMVQAIQVLRFHLLELEKVSRKRFQIVLIPLHRQKALQYVFDISTNDNRISFIRYDIQYYAIQSASLGWKMDCHAINCCLDRHLFIYRQSENDHP